MTEKPIVLNPQSQLAKIASDLAKLTQVDLATIVPESPFLPFLFLSNEKTGGGLPPWHLCLKEGKSQVVQSPFLLVHIFTRHTYRELVGSSYGKRAYEPLSPSETGETTEQYRLLEEVQNPVWKKGYTHLLGIVTEKPLVAKICTCEAFESGSAYWAAPLAEGELKAGKAAKILVTDHSPNLKKSKAGFLYLASYNFVQWESIQIPATIFDLLNTAWMDQSEQVSNFLAL